MPGDINKISDEDVEEFKRRIDTNPSGRVELEGSHPNALDEYQRIATKTAIYPGKDMPLGLMYVALKLNGEAGEIAEHVGKAFRDEDLMPIHVKEFDDRMYIEYNSLNVDRHSALVKEVGDVLWYLSAMCNELGITLSQAALINLVKLNDRTKRNKLSGSGDNR